MALTITRAKDPTTSSERRVIGDCRLITGEIQFDNSYPTGGEAITAAELGFDKSVFELFFNHDPAASRIPVYDKANGKIKLFTALSTEAANASDQSTIKVRFLAVGE